MGSKTEVNVHKYGGQPLEPPSGYESEISAFLAWVQLERGLSRHTVESYETDLIQCACFLGQNGSSNWQSITLEQVSSWFSSLTLDGLCSGEPGEKIIRSSYACPLFSGRGKTGK